MVSPKDIEVSVGVDLSHMADQARAIGDAWHEFADNIEEINEDSDEEAGR